MPTVTKMAWEGELYRGTAGSTAATKVTNVLDQTYTFEIEYGDTTDRGDGSSVPIETESPTLRRVSISWGMLNKPADTSLTALLSAAYAATPIAIRTKSYSSGLGFDGDCCLTVTLGKPKNGSQTYEFTAKPTKESGRDPQLNV